MNKYLILTALSKASRAAREDNCGRSVWDTKDGPVITRTTEEAPSVPHSLVARCWPNGQRSYK